MFNLSLGSSSHREGMESSSSEGGREFDFPCSSLSNQKLTCRIV